MKRNYKFQILNPPAGGLPTTNYSLLTNLGFTLIEILICVTVIFIIVGFGFTGYARFNQRQTLLSAGATLKNSLRDIQSRAVNGEVSCTVCTCDSGSPPSLKGWYADFVNRNFYGECANGFFPTPAPVFNISAKITIVPYITPPDKLLFLGYPPGSASQNATICLSQGNNDPNFYKITVNMAGYISSEDGLVTACP